MNLPNELAVLILKKISHNILNILYINNNKVNNLVKYANIGMIVSDRYDLANYIGVYKLVFSKCNFEEYNLLKFLKIINFRGKNIPDDKTYKITIKKSAKKLYNQGYKKSQYYHISKEIDNTLYIPLRFWYDIPISFWHERDFDVALATAALNRPQINIDWNQ
jgi:hypothetical protein